jgi:hypothetical protein
MGLGGGGGIKDQKPKKSLKKEFKTGYIKLPMHIRHIIYDKD